MSAPDKVRLVGKVFTIEDVYNLKTYKYALRYEPRWLWCDEELELVEDKKVFTKKDLKNGDVVMKRDGAVEIVILPLGTLVVNGPGFNSLNDINDDLTSTGDSDHDIIAVRRPSRQNECTFNAFNYERGELVYDRNAKQTREMTVAEIEEALGYPIKVVK